MKREYPNPVQASRGETALVPNHFHLAGKVVYFVYWPFFFWGAGAHHHLPKVRQG